MKKTDTYIINYCKSQTVQRSKGAMLSDTIQKQKIPFPNLLCVELVLDSILLYMVLVYRDEIEV